MTAVAAEVGSSLAERPIRALASPRPPIAPGELVRTIAERFFADNELEALALVEQDRPVGVVTRARLLLTLARNFGYEIFARRPVSRLADLHPLVLSEETSLVEAVTLALDRAPASIYDDAIVVDENGRYLGLLPVRRLVLEQGFVLATSLAEREAALARAGELEKVDALRAQLMAHVTHELRSPVNAIAGLAELIRAGCDKGAWDKVRPRVELLQTSAASLRTLVRNVLDLSKLEAGRMEVWRAPVDLVALAVEVAEVGRVLAGKKPLAIALDAPEGPLVLDTDAQKVRQALLNLVSNAVKFTEVGQVTLRLRGEAGGALIAVQDTGIGISDEDHGRLFVPFGQIEDPRTKRHEGTGLGLVVARQLMALLGGELALTSTLGVGSTFTITLPARAPAGGEQHG